MSFKKRLWFILLKRKSALAVILSGTVFSTSMVTNRERRVNKRHNYT